jgi:aspartyl-tRNA(Asn)/glutamyl-tRNA(Gln) amidotransferase subunit A
LAVGTQTAGSVIRPAAFCGIVGFKPTFGAIPRTGVLRQSPSLDTLGVFANSVEDAALIADPMFGHDDGDPATRLGPAPRLLDTAQSAPPVTPTLAFVRQPAWPDAHPDTSAAFEELSAELAEECDEVELPGAFGDALSQREIVNLAEMAKNFHAYESRGRDKLSARMREALDKGKAVAARDYLAAKDWPAILNDGLEAIFERFDAIVTPAAPGPAPEGIEATGNPAFNGIWTFCGTPAVTLPLLTAGNGLPMGVQLVGRRGEDGRLLRTARWLAARLGSAD